MKTTFNEIQKIAAEVLECEESQLDLDSGLGHHYKWDSLAHVRLMLVIEEKFGVSIDETNIATLNTVDRIVQFINQENK